MDIDKIRCLVVDDEIIARHGLMTQLNEFSGIEIVGEANNFDDFVFLYEKTKPDVVFLDIRLQKENAIDRLTQLYNLKKPNIVFVTAYSNYAQKSYDFDAIDYLMKPVSKERLEKSINKIKINIDKRFVSEGSQSNLFIKSNGKFFRIIISEILYIQSMENYVQIHTQTQKFICKITMEQVCKSLPNTFLRVHRSFMINKHKVDTLDKQSLFIQGIEIPVSREKKKVVYEELMYDCKFTSD